MIPYLTYIKLGAAVLLLALVAGGSYHVGGMAARTALERDHADMATATVNALLAQRAQATADHNRLQGVIDRYDATPLDPIVPGLAHRVFLYANRADCPVPRTPAVAGGVEAPAPVTLGPSGVERALGDYIAACSADAAQMIPMVELAP